jgi:hypothetical protein
MIFHLPFLDSVPSAYEPCEYSDGEVKGCQECYARVSRGGGERGSEANVHSGGTGAL